MTTGKQLLNNYMLSNYKQDTLYPTYDSDGGFDNPYGNRRQLKKELFDELENEY